jgi:hypothetical protein
VFSVDETRLFCKKMPRRKYITRIKFLCQAIKYMKDRLTLLLGSNAYGDFELKPMLVYVLTIQGASSNRKSSEVNWVSFGSPTIRYR